MIQFSSAKNGVPVDTPRLFSITARPEATGAYLTFLMVLRVTNLISLAFDRNDLWLWLRRNRLSRRVI